MTRTQDCDVTRPVGVGKVHQHEEEVSICLWPTVQHPWRNRTNSILRAPVRLGTRVYLREEWDEFTTVSVVRLERYLREEKDEREIVGYGLSRNDTTEERGGSETVRYLT